MNSSTPENIHNLHTEKIAILDAGSQYGKVIDRRLRELNVYCDLLSLETPLDELKTYKGIIISGGPNSFSDPNAPRCSKEILSLNIPILGICYGMQWLNIAYGGIVEKGDLREDGQMEIKINTENDLFSGLSEIETVLLTHGDSVINVAEGLTVIGRSGNFIAALQDITKPIYGIQFHPEVDLTLNGKKMFENFLFKICKVKGTFKMEDRVEKAISEIREKFSDKDVVCLVSGGVDSSVCCSLLYKALGYEKVHGIHINTGFMRQDESILVEEALKRTGYNLSTVDASYDFYNGTTLINGKETSVLKNTISPEEKRKIIGDTFIKVVLKEIEKRGIKEFYLAQGTLRPDLIESASDVVSSKAEVIKTHHNDTELVREKRKQGLVIEPLKDYHKDEVRILGKMLGLPDYLTQRQPFPGPGLAIRILCLDQPYIKEDFYEIEKKLQEKFNDEENKINLLPIKSVGVQGDGRTYSYVAGVSGKADWKKLFNMTKEITKNFHVINRVVYILDSEDGSEKFNITTTKTYLTEDVTDQLRKADYQVNQIFFNYEDGKYMKKISQLPVILAPISFDGEGKRSIVLRPFITNDFMTGVPAIPNVDFPMEILNKVNKNVISKVKGISRVLYDLTAKPPGTTEWE